MVIRKKTTILILVILLSSLVFSLSTITKFTAGTSKELTFDGSNTENVTINVWEDSYVLNTSFVITGLLSDWITELSYTKLLNPVSGKYISESKWLISDEDTDAVYLVNPNNNSSINTSGKVVLNNPKDAEYVSDNLWYIADYTNDQVLLYNTLTQSFDWKYDISDPTDVDLVSNDLILISANLGGGNREVRLINTTSNATIESVTNIKTVYDAEYISANLWLIADTDNKIKAINPTGDILLWTFSIDQPKAIDYLGNNISLVIDGGLDYVFMVNFSDGTYLMNYSEADKPVDVDYISSTEWLITDKDGSKRISLEKKYYPTDLTLDIGDDGTNEWSRIGELNSNLFLNQNNFSEAINKYLETCNIINNNCTIPFIFHSDTYGKLNISNLNIQVNRKPTLNIINPSENEYIKGIYSIKWNTTDADNDALEMNLFYLNNSKWILINTTSKIPGTNTYNWDTNTVQDRFNKYNIKINVTDNLSPVICVSLNSNFTIDNTKPTINIINPTEGLSLNKNITIEWNSTDNIDDKNLNISIEYSTNNGTNWNVLFANTNNDGFENWDATSIDSNQVLVRINSTDTAGNSNSDKTNSFTIDNTAPKIELISPLNNHNESSNNTITFEFNATDNLKNTLTCELYLDKIKKANKTIISGIANNFIFNSGDGNFEWHINCSDGLNINSSEKRTINIDTEFKAPTFLPTSTITTKTAELKITFNETVKILYSNFNGNNINLLTTDNITFTYNANGLTNGNYILIINATDNYNTNQFNKTYSVSIPPPNTGGSGGGGSNYYCKESWNCGEWTSCSISGTQTRTCIDKNNCVAKKNKPEELQECTYLGSFFENFDGAKKTQENPKDQKTDSKSEEENAKESEKGFEGLTGAVTQNFLDSTPGKISAFLLIALVLTASIFFIRNKIKKK